MYTRSIICHPSSSFGGIITIPLNRILSAWVGAFIFLALLPGHVLAQVRQNVQLGRTYANLKHAQRSLVDELCRQYNELIKRNLKPAEE